MYFVLIAFLISLIYYLGVKVNYFLFIKLYYNNLLKEGLTKENTYTEAKNTFDFDSKWSYFICFSWITTIILLSYKTCSSFDNFIDKKIKQIITK